MRNVMRTQTAETRIKCAHLSEWSLFIVNNVRLIESDGERNAYASLSSENHIYWNTLEMLHLYFFAISILVQLIQIDKFC